MRYLIQRELLRATYTTLFALLRDRDARDSLAGRSSYIKSDNTAALVPPGGGVPASSRNYSIT